MHLNRVGEIDWNDFMISFYIFYQAAINEIDPSAFQKTFRSNALVKYAGQVRWSNALVECCGQEPCSRSGQYPISGPAPATADWPTLVKILVKYWSKPDCRLADSGQNTGQILVKV
jgi:hypothetical protein